MRRSYRLHNRSDEELHRLQQRAERSRPRRRDRSGRWRERLFWIAFGAVLAIIVQRLLDGV